MSYRSQAFLVRSALLLAVAVIAALAGIVPSYNPTSAHAGHDDNEAAEFDLDTPRIVSEETAKHIGLRVEAAGTRQLEEVVEISGVVKAVPDRHRVISSRVAGRVLDVLKQVGDAVKAGEVVARIESPELSKNVYEVRKLEVDFQRLQLDIDQAKADVERQAVEIDIARAQQTLAETEFSRMEKLVPDAVVARREFDQKKAELAQARGELRLKDVGLSALQRRIESLQRQAEAMKVSREALLAMNNLEAGTDLAAAYSGLLELKAPLNGVVISRTIQGGQWVNAGQSVLEIADYSVVQVEGELPESLIARIQNRETGKARIRTPADSTFLAEGSIQFIAPQLDPIKRTAHLLVQVPNPKTVLRGEMWVNLAIVLREQKEALVVPRSAVVVMGPMHFVFLQNGDKYEKQDINPGIQDDRYVEIKDGLFPGDSVVVQGAYSLTQLRPKTPKKAEPDAESKDHKNDGHKH
jgi:multidrug efflux pump subunit AcrA (membrane-fusion protein)